MSENNIINDEQMSEIAGGYDRIQNSNQTARKFVSAKYAIRSINSADTESRQIRMANRQV